MEFFTHCSSGKSTKYFVLDLFHDEPPVDSYVVTLTLIFDVDVAEEAEEAGAGNATMTAEGTNQTGNGNMTVGTNSTNS
jgi:hypothetical protein